MNHDVKNRNKLKKPNFIQYTLHLNKRGKNLIIIAKFHSSLTS